MTLLIAGNWKLNKTITDAELFCEQIQDLQSNHGILICSSPTLFSTLKDKLPQGIALGAQSVSDQDTGAYTGEVSARMVKDAGCTYTLVGHSERRHVYNEDNKHVNAQVHQALHQELKVILCVGETDDERSLDETEDVIDQQLKEGLAAVSEDQLKHITIAYEPVWAIGTGKTASSEDAQAVHAFIKAAITQLYSEEAASQLRMLYGGSVKPDNAKELTSQRDIHGVLIGGASLKAETFSLIIENVR